MSFTGLDISLQLCMPLLPCLCRGRLLLVIRRFLFSQLTAGSRDIRAPAVPDKDRVVGIHEDLLESKDPGHGGALIRNSR